MNGLRTKISVPTESIGSSLGEIEIVTKTFPTSYQIVFTKNIHDLCVIYCGEPPTRGFRSLRSL